LPVGKILKDNTTVEVRSGAFGSISGTLYKAIGGIIDIDFGSVHKDVISGQKRVTTGITLGGELFGFEFGIKLWKRNILFEDFPPGCLYCEPADWWDPYGSPPWETGVSDGVRRKGLGGSIGFGIGVDVGHDPLGDLNDILIWGERGLGPRGGRGGGPW
jgi:hypothetical protein